MIGPLPPRLGGAAQAMATLTDELSRHPGLQVNLVDTCRKPGPFSQALRIVQVLRHTLRQIKHVDVVTVHYSDPAVGGLVFALTRLFRRPLLVHRFGGADAPRYWRGPRAYIERLLLKSAELNLFQTRLQIENVKNLRMKRVEQYPNNRPLPDHSQPSIPRASCTRYVFLGHVNRDKGVDELIAAGERLPDGLRVDVFGELCGGVTEDDFKGLKRVRYCGALRHDDVISTLRNYDALVLPSHYEREGHPGVIIEAYQAGLPVVATDFMAIPEIVDDTTGILVPPYNSDALFVAMERLHNEPELYGRLREGAIQRGRAHSTAIWAPRFVEFCREISR